MLDKMNLDTKFSQKMARKCTHLWERKLAHITEILKINLKHFFFKTLPGYLNLSSFSSSPIVSKV